MGHLSEYMLGYYVRPKDTYQENIAYSEKVIREIAGDDLTPIGLMGSDLRENIKLFISERKLNVKTDTSQIMEALGNKLVIRGKTGGVCIKTSLMPCARDAGEDLPFTAVFVAIFAAAIGAISNLMLKKTSLGDKPAVSCDGRFLLGRATRMERPFSSCWRQDKSHSKPN